MDLMVLGQILFVETRKCYIDFNRSKCVQKQKDADIEYELLVITPLPFPLNLPHSVFSDTTSVPPVVPAVGLTVSEAGPVPPQTQHTPLSSQKNKYPLNTMQGLIPLCSKATSRCNGQETLLRCFLSRNFLICLGGTPRNDKLLAHHYFGFA